MTLQEFSNEFDILINSYFVTGNYQVSTPVDLDDYEKSVLLTKAQNDIVKQIYNGTLGVPFEGTEEARRDLDALICEREIKEGESLITKVAIKNKIAYKVDISSENPWFIVYESATLTHDENYCNNENCCKLPKEVAVVPTRLDELERTLNNPFRGANMNRVLRIDSGKDEITLIPPKGKIVSGYKFKYIKKPSPIILVDLAESKLSIDGLTDPTDCELNSNLHRTILEMAIKLALNKIENSTPKTQEE